jgi:hypothetical protein
LFQLLKSDSRYEQLVDSSRIMGPGSIFEKATVFGVPVPNFWCSIGKLRDQWKEYKAMFHLRHSGSSTSESYMWDVEECLRFVFSSKTYMQYFDTPTTVEAIVRGDGMPVGSSHACFLLLTFGNFGLFGKCLGFNFPINLAEISEKNREEVREAFWENLCKLNQWSKVGYLQVFPQLTIRIRVEWGGDESWLRMMLGLLSSKEQLACIKCLWLRDTEYLPETRIDRTIESMIEFAKRGTLDQSNMPFILYGTMDQIHHCGMHAIIPFGKDILQRSFEHLQRCEGAQHPLWLQAQQWLKKHHISVDIAYPEETIY